MTTLPLGSGGAKPGRPVNRHASTHKFMCRHVAGCVFVHMLATEELCGCGLAMPLYAQVAMHT